jgi:hypothetical protein
MALQALLYEDGDWFYSTENRDQWRAIMNMVIRIGLYERPIIS